MPLYLVRWPGTRASLVKSANEEELLLSLDEIDSPGEFTWSIYRGPLWIDFELPIKAKLEQRHPGPLRPDEFEVTDVEEFLDGRLRVASSDTDVAFEMEAEILRGAFPKAAAVFDEREEETPDRELLRKGIVADVVAHDEATALDGARIGPGFRLDRTTTWIFKRDKRGTFAELPAKTFFEFICGDNSLEPDGDGAVHVCFLEVTLKKKKPVEARIASWSRFPTEKHGTIRAAYNAREFMTEWTPATAAPDGVLEAASRFLDERKKALAWTPEPADVVAAVVAVHEKAGAPIVVDDE